MFVTFNLDAKEFCAGRAVASSKTIPKVCNVCRFMCVTSTHANIFINFRVFTALVAHNVDVCLHGPVVYWDTVSLFLYFLLKQAVYYL